MSYNKLIKIVPLILLFFCPIIVLAQGATGPVEIDNPLQHGTFEELFNAVFNFIVWLAIALVPIVIIIAAFMLFGAGDQPEKVQTAKTIIKWAIIGLVIILASRALYTLIRTVIDEDYVPPEAKLYNIENKYVEESKIKVEV